MNATAEATTPMEWDVISQYTRAQAIKDGLLVDVTGRARRIGLKFPVAITRAVWAQYVEPPAEMQHHQDLEGRLWDVLWMLRCAITSGRIDGAEGTFEVIFQMPDKGNWQTNEKMHEGSRTQRLVTLKALCGPGDDFDPCITILRPEED